METNLPTGIGRKTRYLHSMGGSPGSGSGSLAVGAFALSSSSGKLDSHSFSHEVGSV